MYEKIYLYGLIIGLETSISSNSHLMGAQVFIPPCLSLNSVSPPNAQTPPTPAMQS
jgi:hypothetical protein